MIWFVLTILLLTKDGPATVSGAFPDRFTCEQAEGRVATAANADKNVIGWSTLGGCKAVPELNKV